MGSKWRKAKFALGMNLCFYVSETADDSPPSSEGNSDAALLTPATSKSPTMPSHRFQFSRTSSKASKQKTCTICFGRMKHGDGHAIFTAECSHSFHFQCITSNVKHGNWICPVCRAKWKEIPVHVPILEPPSGRTRVNPLEWAHNNAVITGISQLSTLVNSHQHMTRFFQLSEPSIFNDDEALNHPSDSGESSTNSNTARNNDQRTISIKVYPEVPEVARFNAYDDFTVLIHLRAPASVSGQNLTIKRANLHQFSETPRASIDLVTVLDVSGSMAGTKLALLKRAMGFVIQNLGPNDRLAVIAFSSAARRVFSLCRMSDNGRRQALQAVNSLVANGGTNIAEGLRKGVKIMEDRREKNPVASVILLSDGQDTYTVGNYGGNQQQPNYQLLIPSIHAKDGSCSKIPVHAFGFGTNHDASLMHSISEISGGTFSFIETESVIQDAFAQCIGGLLSVVVKELQVEIKSVDPNIYLGSLRTGSYPNRVVSDGHIGIIDVGDLYADEERDFLVSIYVPAEFSSDKTSLLKVKCVYQDPLTKDGITSESGVVCIKRPEMVEQEMVSIEVDRQRNRISAAEAMGQARITAEKGDLPDAVSKLQNCRKLLSETVSAKSGDRLCVALNAELKEMQEKMASRHVYETSGRAYILSGLSSHSLQRATLRGDSTYGSSLVQAYQTPSMVEMLCRSQDTLLK